MPTKKHKTPRQSKAQFAVALQVHSRSINDQLKTLRDTAASLLEAEAPTKRQRRELLNSAESLLSL